MRHLDSSADDQGVLYDERVIEPIAIVCLSAYGLTSNFHFAPSVPIPWLPVRVS